MPTVFKEFCCRLIQNLSFDVRERHFENRIYGAEQQTGRDRYSVCKLSGARETPCGSHESVAELLWPPADGDTFENTIKAKLLTKVN